jgi:hypothetical protein
MMAEAARPRRYFFFFALPPVSAAGCSCSCKNWSYEPLKSIRPFGVKANRRVANWVMRSRSWATTKQVPS